MAKSFIRSCMINNDSLLGACWKNDLDNNISKYSRPRRSGDLVALDGFKNPSAIHNNTKSSLSNKKSLGNKEQ
ncbi:hypothetical protein HanIR_Chr13g0668211 [Helianthus annuus]|nr:hypothetical protein HanIR_Chr13g0668211 [Helianthus annuus]